MTSERPNIVLVTADSVRADHCGFVNRDADTTPMLDELAGRSVTFETAIAPGPRTPSSVPEIVTGQAMPYADVDSNSLQSQVEHMRAHLSRYRTLAERLSEEGYSTAAYTANPYTTSHSGFDAGFDHFYSIESSERSALEDWGIQVASKVGLGVLASQASQFRRKEKYFSQWPTLYRKARPTIEAMAEPYFVWFFLLDAHNPYLVPRADRIENSTLAMYYSVFRSNTKLNHTSTQSGLKPTLPANVASGIERAYRDAVRSVDRFVGVLDRELAGDEPLLIFHSDHGEGFNEHGSYGHQPELYEENVHTPLLVHDPTAETTGTIREPVSLRVLPDMVVSYVVGEEELTSDRWRSEHATSDTVTGHKVAVRGKRWKYISTNESTELYDLERDPTERTNLADHRSTERDALEAVLRAYIGALPEPDRSISRRGRGALPSEIEESLRALGYRE